MSEAEKIRRDQAVYSKSQQEQDGRKPVMPPNNEKEFEKILKNGKSGKEGYVDDDMDDPTLSKEGKQKGFIPMPMQEVDPRFNQMPTMAKDEKVAPALGKELPTGPSDEPWTMPFIETAAKDPGATGKGPALADEMSHKKMSMLSPDKGEVIVRSPKTDLSDFYDPSTKFQATQNIPQDNPLNIFNTASSNVAVRQMQSIIDQIVEHLRIVQMQSQIDTTMKIKNLGSFEGATVTVTSYPTAGKEINVAFENLTQRMKNTLDLNENMDILKQALDQKGYTVHMITTTTVERTYPDTNIAQREGRGDSSQQQQQQKQRDDIEEQYQKEEL